MEFLLQVFLLFLICINIYDELKVMLGGSMSNMYGMVLARFKKFPEVKTKGVASLGHLVAFTSQEVSFKCHEKFKLQFQTKFLSQGHYSISKAAHWLGLGTDNLIIVPSDCAGRMIPHELETEILKALAQNKVPFFVNATSGTTVLGAYDPLIPLAGICKKYDIWLHVDVRLRIFQSILLPYPAHFNFICFMLLCSGSLGRRCSTVSKIPLPDGRHRNVRNFFSFDFCFLSFRLLE